MAAAPYNHDGRVRIRDLMTSSNKVYRAVIVQSHGPYVCSCLSLRNGRRWRDRALSKQCGDGRVPGGAAGLLHNECLSSKEC